MQSNFLIVHIFALHQCICMESNFFMYVLHIVFVNSSSWPQVTLHSQGTDPLYLLCLFHSLLDTTTSCLPSFFLYPGFTAPFSPISLHKANISSCVPSSFLSFVFLQFYWDFMLSEELHNSCLFQSWVNQCYYQLHHLVHTMICNLNVGQLFVSTAKYPICKSLREEVTLNYYPRVFISCFCYLLTIYYISVILAVGRPLNRFQYSTFLLHLSNFPFLAPFIYSV